MKKVSALLFISLFPFLLLAKNDKGERVIATLADGSKIEGFTTSRLINYMKPDVSKVKISNEPGGEGKEYTSEEVIELVFPPSGEDSNAIVYQSVNAQKQLPNPLNKNPKTYKKPVFMRLIYNGDHVKGYVRPVRGASYSPSMTEVNFTWQYYYKVADEDVTKAYWVDTNDLIPNIRKQMKFYFREFPGVQKLIDDKELDPKEFRENPTIVLPLMDADASSR